MRHRFHALCPYFAMFPETFAESWIDKLTRRGDMILDPFCGRGTTPFQALLMNRRAIACDVNPAAYCITRAKTNAPAESSLRRRIAQLERDYDPKAVRAEAELLPEFYSCAYHPDTLRQLVYLRRQLRWRESKVDCMMAALALGALHGEAKPSSPYFSNQMPRTISTKPDYSVRYWRRHGLVAPHRQVFDLLQDRVSFRYTSSRPEGTATVLCGDMRDLPRSPKLDSEAAQAVITSPPYLNVTNFEEDQWLRLWFLGGPPYPTRNRVSKDDRHYGLDGYWQLIADMWRTLSLVVARKGHVVLRIGMKNVEPDRIVAGLEGCSVVTGRKVRLVSSETSEIRNRQTDAFRPGSLGCLQEVDAHFVMV
jgi:hypothetical protein